MGSRNIVTTDPRHIGDILAEMLRCRLLFKDVHPNTELGIDLKLFTSQPGRLELGECHWGTLVRDDEYHFTFVEAEPEAEATEASAAKATTGSAPEATDARGHDAPEANNNKGTRVKRNPIEKAGDCVNRHRTDDGQPYLTFLRPRFKTYQEWADFYVRAAQEILAQVCLGEEVIWNARP